MLSPCGLTTIHIVWGTFYCATVEEEKRYPVLESTCHDTLDISGRGGGEEDLGSRAAKAVKSSRRRSLIKTCMRPVPSEAASHPSCWQGFYMLRVLM